MYDSSGQSTRANKEVKRKREEKREREEGVKPHKIASEPLSRLFSLLFPSFSIFFVSLDLLTPLFEFEINPLVIIHHLREIAFTSLEAMLFANFVRLHIEVIGFWGINLKKK